MIKHRPATSRGRLDGGPILSYRTFTFGKYRNAKHMNYGLLEAINDDHVHPGFETDPHIHVNREIFGYVVSGPCRHTDETGTSIDIPSGAVQRMSAGTGFKHTEGNTSIRPIRYLQLWIRSEQKNLAPVWNWHQFSRADKLNCFCDITAQLPIRADAKLLAGIFTQSFIHQIQSTRKYYLYVVSGIGTINGTDFVEGDGFAFEHEQQINITVNTESELILFDLP